MDEKESELPSPTKRLVPTVLRRPSPYAMVNVPHKLELADSQKFRKLYSSSPACPHGDTAEPVGNRQPKTNASLDLDYAFNLTTPVAKPKKSASLQRMASHIKLKVSESRLSKHSSRMSSKDNIEFKTQIVAPDPTLTLSVTSTDLTELLESKQGSVRGYDSDAKSIETSVLQSVAGTIKARPGHATKLPSINCVTRDRLTTPNPMNRDIGVPERSPSTARKVRSSPLPHTPEKITFSEAFQLKIGESPIMALKRLSAGMANGSIKPPTERELQGLKTPRSAKSCESDLPFDPPLRTTSIRLQPDSPQTAVLRLSQRVQEEQRLSMRTNSSDGKQSKLLADIDPALLDYLSRFSPAVSPGRNRVETSPKALVSDRETQSVMADKSPGQEPRTAPSAAESVYEGASLVSCVPSEQPSVHLFDMQISQRLASKSTATMLSPANSTNASRKSFVIPPLPLMGTTQKPQTSTNSHTEHNRLPSDPYTKRIFEASETQAEPSWTRRPTSTGSEVANSLELDNTSSCYTSRRQSSIGSQIAPFDGPAGVRNLNSIAMGGRQASNRLPSLKLKALSDTKSVNSNGASAASVPPIRNVEDLQAAENVISKYSSMTTKTQTTEGSLKLGLSEDRSGTDAQEVDASIAGHSSKARKADAYLNVQHPATDVSSSDRAAFESAEPVYTPSILSESAIDMWNRAYREARKDSSGKDLLSTPIIDTDKIRRLSSAGALNCADDKNASMASLCTVIRRSKSVGNLDDVGDESRSSGLRHKASQALKRLSMLQLRNQRSLLSPDVGSAKIRKRSTVTLLQKRSSTPSPVIGFKSVRLGRTPPLKELLGIWGSFPSHTRRLRNGCAGASDNVRTQDFAAHACQDDFEEAAVLTPDDVLGSKRSRSSIQVKPDDLTFHRREARKKAYSMTFPQQISVRQSEKGSSSLFRRWRKLYRTKSSDYRAQALYGGRRTSLFPESPLAYPELEILPGEGMLGYKAGPAVSSDNIDDSSMQRRSSNPGLLNGFESETHHRTNVEHRMSGLKPVVSPDTVRHHPSTWELLVCNSTDNIHAKRLTSTTLAQSKEEKEKMLAKREAQSPDSLSPGPFGTSRPRNRTSKELRMPGSFAEYEYEY